LLTLSRETAAGANGAIEVFVWPEGALRVDPAQARNRAVLEFVRSTGAEVWTGANHYERDRLGRPIVHNSAFRIFGRGSIDRRYDKNVLVPFGEYVPLRGVIPGIERVQAIGDFEAGADVPIYDTGRARFVFLICYEAIRSAFVRASLRDGANLIVNVTVDAWYGDTSEQSQHLMLAAAQSALNGVPLVRATTTGISAVVDARGVITDATGVFTRAAIVREVRPVRVSGPYARWGEWFAWLCVAASALLIAAGTTRGRAASTGSRLTRARTPR
jgi:apolipoprotein N-acyltransferase